MYSYIYMYIYVCVCVCVCVLLTIYTLSSDLHKIRLAPNLPKRN
jgi:hypothetical protein